MSIPITRVEIWNTCSPPAIQWLQLLMIGKVTCIILIKVFKFAEYEQVLTCLKGWCVALCLELYFSQKVFIFYWHWRYQRPSRLQGTIVANVCSKLNFFQNTKPSTKTKNAEKELPDKKVPDEPSKDPTENQEDESNTPPGTPPPEETKEDESSLGTKFELLYSSWG